MCSTAVSIGLRICSELVPYGDFNYNVVLQLRDGKKYIFSVLDAEDCCAEIMAKVEQYANK